MQTGFSRRRPGAWGGGTEAASVVDASLAAGLISLSIVLSLSLSLNLSLSLSLSLSLYIYIYIYI